jgi:putative flippase GtrA
MLVLNQIKFFLIFGVITVLIDYSAYRALIFFEFNFNSAKIMSFILGTIFSFGANKNITFSRKNDFFKHLIKFILLYFVSLMLNVFVNTNFLGWLASSNFNVQISFILATIVSATINFIGMKYFIFK